MSQPDLFLQVSESARSYRGDPEHQADGTNLDIGTRIERSALWAAYGDALGWISELTDANGLKRRTGGEPLIEPITWKRKIGGRSGVTASLPKGCYSDDSQLRLATGRAIRASGFDVDAFAKAELPVFTSYGLGAGIATTKAAENLVKPKCVWWNNNFKGWINSGGNGAAMRVQPHVWAAKAKDGPDIFLLDVVRNSVCTHSHPTGLMGAVLHALCLNHVLRQGCLPSPEDVEKAIEVASGLSLWIDNDQDLFLWRKALEGEAGDFRGAWEKALEEARHALQRIRSIGDGGSPEARYEDMLRTLDLHNRECMGSGVLTALAAVGLTWCEDRPREAMRISANALGTDTDTIATMAGAILGSIADEDPPVEVLDSKLFRAEARRLARIAGGENPQCHQYPDLMHWQAPKSRADRLVQTASGALFVNGLGSAEDMGERILIDSNGRFRWQWVKLEFGQTLLIKRREKLSQVGPNGLPRGRPNRRAERSVIDSRKPQSGDAMGTKREVPSPEFEIERQRSAESIRKVMKTVSQLRKHIDDPETTVEFLRRVVTKGQPDEVAGVFSALPDLLRKSATQSSSSADVGTEPVAGAMRSKESSGLSAE